jgi:hypothetical protein
VYWIALGLTGASLALSVTTLYVVLGVRRSSRRTERSGDERLEILREQQERLGFLREERRMLEEELGWRRKMMDGKEHVLELDAAPSEPNGHPVSEQTKPLSWLWRIAGRMG